MEKVSPIDTPTALHRIFQWIFRCPFIRRDWRGLELGMPQLRNINGKIADTLQRHEREKEPRHRTLEDPPPALSLSLRVSERN